MKARKYFMEIYTAKGTRASNELSGLVFTANLRTAKAVGDKIVADNKNSYDEIKVVSVSVENSKMENYSHIEPRGEINGIEYGR